MSAQRYLVFFATISWTLLQKIEGQIPTKNPCEYFRYIQENGEVVGLITLPNDLSQEYRLNVNMSLATYFTGPQDIRLQLVTGIDDIRNGQPLQYRVLFPIQTVLPFQTRVEFNGQVYCSGPPQELGDDGVTGFWATMYLWTGKPRPGLEAFTTTKHPNINSIEHNVQSNNHTDSAFTIVKNTFINDNGTLDNKPHITTHDSTSSVHQVYTKNTTEIKCKSQEFNYTGPDHSTNHSTAYNCNTLVTQNTTVY